MMYPSLMVLSIEWLVLLSGAVLLIWSLRHPGAGALFAKIIGLITMVGSLALLTWTAVDYFRHGDVAYRPGTMRQMQGMGGGMGCGGMDGNCMMGSANCPMMPSKPGG